MFQQYVSPQFEGKEECGCFYERSLHIAVWKHNNLFPSPQT